MDIFTAHPILFWAVVGCLGAIAFCVLLPVLLSAVSLLMVLAVAFFGGIFALFTHLRNEKWGLWAVVIALVLIAVAVLCFIF